MGHKLKLRTLQIGDTIELEGGQVAVPYARPGWTIRRFTITQRGGMPYVQIEHESNDGRRSGKFQGQLYGHVPGVEQYDPHHDNGVNIGSIDPGPGCISYIIIVSDRQHSLHEAAHYTGLHVIRDRQVIFGP